MALLLLTTLTASLVSLAYAVQVSQTASTITFSNSELSFDLLTSNGYIRNIVFRNTSLLGPPTGLSAQVYTDWPSNAFGLIANNSRQIIEGSDYAGIVITDNNTAAGSLVQRSWFLRDGEAGLHSFVRLNYYNATVESLGALGEVRTMFRPNPDDAPWTHIVTNSEQYATHPSDEALANEIQVQDATWYIGNTPNDPYVLEEGDYWTKYSFADNQTNKARGLFGGGQNNESLGAWWVINQKDTFFGGPSHFDLMVDGIIYNKLSTGHGGAASPNVTTGFDRTFGPQFLYFNHGSNATLLELLADAEKYADPTWNAEFYDAIAPNVVGYVPTSGRGSVSGKVALPDGASKVVVALSANGVDLQDSAEDIHAYQYWVEDVELQGGVFEIGRVKVGTYRLTVYATGIFGDFTLDDVVVEAGNMTALDVAWTADSAGTELWRIGTPDRSAGEFRNGWEKDYTRLNHPANRSYWGAWDFPTQFPTGVNFTVGKSDVGQDWNYIHWSQYGGTFTRPGIVTTNVNAWQINFDLAYPPPASVNATLTILLAGAATSSGNTGVVQGAWPFVPISISINEQNEPFVWTITPQESGSCGVRSAISCYLLSNKFVFPGTWLNAGHNNFIIALPVNVSGIYIQYDALRLEIQE
ncbi:galactose mutarotase-like protein [Roridomyces roridus]|uniref:rhamnogalacturonan endolyase n=1 Tax=Roridomyces roridus TaxID=1738132 RepID=A0AAD7BE21_9AGAR|nr:galactose mutarotase-like protein [Roridomyces roridus]